MTIIKVKERNTEKMTNYVIKDRRTGPTNRKGYKVIAPCSFIGIIPQTEIPLDIQSHWEKNKEAFGYASLRGLTVPQLNILTGLAKGAVVRLNVNRWGDIYVYKIV